MRTHQFPILLISLAITSCSQASAAMPDPANDVNCSVLAFYFKGLGEPTGAKPSQQQSLARVHGWYSRKVQEISQEKGAEAVLSRAGPVLETVKKDPLAMRDAHMACAKRAIGEGLH
jgi:hypothetical protein